MLLIWSTAVCFSEKWIKIQWFSSMKMHLKMSSANFLAILFWPQYVTSSPPSAAYMCQWIGSLLVQVMACHLLGAKPSPQTMYDILSIKPLGTSEIQIKIQTFSFMKMHLKILSVKWQPFCPGGDDLTYPYFLWRQWWDDWTRPNLQLSEHGSKM